MNKIVRNGFPVARLPEELKDGLPAWGRVTLEIEVGDPAVGRVPLAELAGSFRNVHGTEEQTIAHLRALRDEE